PPPPPPPPPPAPPPRPPPSTAARPTDRRPPPSPRSISRQLVGIVRPPCRTKATTSPLNAAVNDRRGRRLAPLPSTFFRIRTPSSCSRPHLGCSPVGGKSKLFLVPQGERSPAVHSRSLRPTLRCGERGPTRFPGLGADGARRGFALTAHAPAPARGSLPYCQGRLRWQQPRRLWRRSSARRAKLLVLDTIECSATGRLPRTGSAVRWARDDSPF